MSSCFASRKNRTGDREPLLPQYSTDNADDTALQRELHKKLHSYQMLRAIGQGFMPSTEQAIVNLRTILASDVLQTTNPDLSDSGRLLVKYSKLWLQQLMDLLQHKNAQDQIQDSLWNLSHSKVDLDVEDITGRAYVAKAKADTTAAYESVRTVGSLLLANSDFRIFLADLNTIGREVFKESAFKVSEVAQEAGKKLEPSKEEKEALSHPGADSGPAPSTEALADPIVEASKTVAAGAAAVADEARHSLADKLSGDEKDTLIHRLKQAVLKLKKRPNYSDSVSTISLLLKRYAKAYSRAAQEAVNTVEADVHVSPEMDHAVKNFWSFLTSFGDRSEWEELERRFRRVLDHTHGDPQVENLVRDVGNSLESLLTDPDFFEHVDSTYQELKEKANHVGTNGSVRDDIDGLFRQIRTAFESVLRDDDVARLLNTTSKIISILSPANAYTNGELISDSIKVFVPLLISAVQYVPIPRLEISTPDVDLLLENLILEPGRTVNRSSFLPYKLHVNANNDFEIRKARTRVTSSAKSTITIQLSGLSVRATDIGYWLRAHSGILRFVDSGLASFALDERGLDLTMSFSIRRDQPTNVLTLLSTSARIHKLQYTLRRSRFSPLAWLFGPLIRPILRVTLERQIASALADALRSANTELVFARERLRAARIADPASLLSFVRAVIARWSPEPDPDLYVRVGVDQPFGARGAGAVFRGVYAPGSVVKLWHEEGQRAAERIEDGQVNLDGWRNEVFDVQTVPA